MNSNISVYSNPNSTAIPIQITEDILANWIKEHYNAENVKFIITSTETSNFSSSFIKILPLEELEDNFKISAVLRRKKSGTVGMPAKYYLEVTQLLKEKVGNNFILSKDGNLKYDGGDLDKKYLGEDFYIRKEGSGYQIRKRSNTNNPNIVFSLKYNGLHKSEGLEKLKAFILKQI